MLTFITPILLGFTGAIFLKETLSLRGMLSGCRRRWSTCCDCSSQNASMQLHWRYFDCPATVSFWWSQGRSIRGSDARGKDAIRHVGRHLVSCAGAHSILLRSAGLIGVLGATSACECASLD
jgi:hypothetical protein